MVQEAEKENRSDDKLLGSIYEGNPDHAFPETKFFIKRYNARTGEKEYLGLLPDKFDSDYIKNEYGGGKYFVEARKKGVWVARTEIVISGRPNLEPAHAEPANGSDQPESPGNGRRSGEEELDRALAKAVKYKALSDIINPRDHKNGNGNDLDLQGTLKQILLKNLDRDPIKELAAAASQINSFKNVFGKGGRAPVASYESIISENFSEILDLVRERWNNKSETNQDKKESKETLDEGTKDMEFIIKKLYSMAQKNVDPRNGVALVLSVLPKKDVDGLVKSSAKNIAFRISAVFPDMKKFITSEAGQKWLTNFHDILRENISSRKVSPEPSKKLNSSGNSSEKGGPTRPSSVKQKTSSAISRSGTKKPRRGRSTTG